MAKVPTQISLTAIALDASSAVPLYRQLYDSIRAAILSGQLASGLKIPSSREMARDLSVSRNTVAGAFDQLIAEGYLEAQTGAGTFVSKKIPDELLYASNKTNSQSPKNAAKRELSKRGKTIAATSVSFPLDKQRLRPFAPCLPSVEDFPLQIWAKLAGHRLRYPARNLLNYGEAAGYRPLREEIAAYLGAARGVRCAPEQVIVVTGTQQAVDLTARILLDADDTVWVEDPGYLGSRGAMNAAQARIVPVPIDAEGIEVETGVKLAPDARLICVTPSHQYPLGVTMSLKRRLELLRWASRAGAWILEDDYDSEYRYEGRPLAALQGLDNDNRVIYTGTFSKVLSPALRIGYLVAPPDLVDAFTAGKALLDRHSPIFEQMILADFFAAGHFARHIRRMRNLYAERRDAFISAAKSELNGLLEIAPSAAGLHLIGWLNNNLNDTTAARAAAENGVDCEPLSALSIRKTNRQGLVLGYASFDEKHIKEGAERLATALQNC